MRKEATALVGQDLVAELVPFTFPQKSGGEEIKPAALAYIPNLWDADYEFETLLFGLSGASGITEYQPLTYVRNITLTSQHPGCHCCLWCTIRGDQLKLPPGDHGQKDIQLRTTDSILSDHGKFVADGERLKRAKLFNNVIHEPLRTFLCPR